MNYYPHHIGDFRSGTIHMTRMERWLYRDMIDVYYDTEKPFPLEVERVCAMVGARGKEDRALVESVLEQKFLQTPAGYIHQRCDEEIAAYREKQQLRSKGGHAAKQRRAVQQPITSTAGSDAPAPLQHSTSNANQEPRTKNQEPNTLPPPDGGGVPGGAEDTRTLPLFGDDEAPKSSTPPCPHQDIIALYHEVLPMCPRVHLWTDTRQGLLRTRWNEDPERQNLAFWRTFFEYVAASKFLTGRASGKGDKPFLADLEWIVRPSNFVKIYEGKYADQ